MNSLPSAGSTFFSAWGMTIEAIVVDCDKPKERPASVWPGSTAIMPARIISETYAPELMLNAKIPTSTALLEAIKIML